MSRGGTIPVYRPTGWAYLKSDCTIRIEVWDSALDLPTLSDDSDTAIKHGCYPAARGKVIWAELPVLPRRLQPHAPFAHRPTN